MKHNGFVKKPAAVLLALILTVLCAGSLAEEGSLSPAASSQTVASLLKVLDFKFFVREDGIGKGRYPVFTAPAENSLRLSDGQASCSVDAEIGVAGFVNGWLMVRYEVKDKKARVGYIEPRYSRGFKTGVGKIEFNAIPVELAEDTEITDNPRSNSTPFGTLPKGTAATVLAKYTYTGNWWYVETTLDGKLTRGFINRSTAALLVDGTVYRGNVELGFPVASPEGMEQVGMLTITCPEDRAMILRRKSDPDSAMVARVYGGDVFPCYGEEKGANGRIWYHVWVDGVWGWFSSASSKLTEGK